jgi:hypothetical protein
MVKYFASIGGIQDAGWRHFQQEVFEKKRPETFRGAANRNHLYVDDQPKRPSLFFFALFIIVIL